MYSKNYIELKRKIEVLKKGASKGIVSEFKLKIDSILSSVDPIQIQALAETETAPEKSDEINVGNLGQFVANHE